MDTISKYRLYPFKVWLSTVASGPFIFLSLAFFDRLLSSSGTEPGEFFSGIGAALYLGGFGLILSLPFLIFYLAVFYICSRYVRPVIALKIILTLTTITGIAVTFWVIGFNPLSEAFVFLASYAFPAILFHLMYKINVQPLNNGNTEYAQEK